MADERFRNESDVMEQTGIDDRGVADEVVNIQPTTIKAPDALHPKSLERSGESVADPAEGGNKRHPEHPLSSETKSTVQESTGSSHETNPDAIVSEGRGKAKASGEKNDAEAVESYTDVQLEVDEEALDTARWASDEQRQAARQLARRAQMSTRAAQVIVDNMPAGIGAQVYAQAETSLYRLGVSEVESFEKALELTGSSQSLGGATRQVLALGQLGRNALELAYLQGVGEAEAYHAARVQQLGSGKGVLREDAGQFYTAPGKLSRGKTAEDAWIELTAGATATTARRVVDEMRADARGCLKAATGELLLGSQADAGTVMHETFHALNSWSPETGQAVMDRLMEHLVQRNGMENTEKLVEGYLDRYARAGQKLSYNQAVEEVTADALRTVFGTREGFRDFVRQQAIEAKLNASARGAIDQVMERIEELLHKVLADLKHFLHSEPTNAAAKAARSLTEEQLKDLQALYFEHQAQAGENYRAALEDSATKNAPAETDGAGTRYQIDEDFFDEIDKIDISKKRRVSKRIRVGATSEVLKSIGVKDQSIYWDEGKIRKILEKHSEKNYQKGVDDSIVTKEIIKQVPDVLERPIIVLHSDVSRKMEYGSRIYMFGEVYDATGKLLSVSLELVPTSRKGVELNNIMVTSAYGKKNVQNGLNRDQILYVDPDKKRTDTWLADNRLQLPLRITKYGSIASLQYDGENVKPFFEKNEARYQLDVDAEDVERAEAEAVGNVDEKLELLRAVLSGQKGVSEDWMRCVARSVLADYDSRLSQKLLTERLKALNEYLVQEENADWRQVYAFAADMAEQIMERSNRRNSELWDNYPELHEMSMKLERGSRDFEEVVYRWGSWTNARKELARHGIRITQSKEGVVSRWDADFAELQEKAGGLLPTETPNSAADALDAMAAAHDAVKPVMENDYQENWEQAKQDIAMQILQRYMEGPGLASEQNAKQRAAWAQQREELRKTTSAEAIEAEARARLEQLQSGGVERTKLLEPYRKETARAKERQRIAEEFAKKQKLSVEARVQLEKERRKKQVQKARDAREKDNTRRAIRRLTGELTQMTERPNEKQYCPEALLSRVRPVVMLANDAIGNHEAAKRMGRSMSEAKAANELEGAMRQLKAGISQEMALEDRAALEWRNSGLEDAIDDWLAEVQEAREPLIRQLQWNLKQAEKIQDERLRNSYISVCQTRLEAYEAGEMAGMSLEQLRGLERILEQTLFIIRNENRILGEEESAMLDDFAAQAGDELRETKGLSLRGGAAGKLEQLWDEAQNEVLSPVRMFRRMGGWHTGGAMEQLGKMLNDGQLKKNRVLAEGEAIFADVTGKENRKALWDFTHELVDIGLKTQDGRVWRVTHDQMVALWLQMQNRRGMHHILHGGLKIDNMEKAVKGDTEMAHRERELVLVGELKATDEQGNVLSPEDAAQQEGKLQQTILERIDRELTEYDRKVLEDYKKFGEFTKKHINETSVILSGRKKAMERNYLRMKVDGDSRAEQNAGICWDNSVGSKGFLKARVNSARPLVLEGIFEAVNGSLEDVAQYAGMAIPVRNVEKLLNTNVGGETLYTQIERVWGADGKKRVKDLLADVTGGETGTRKPGIALRTLRKVRSGYAGGVLTLNVGVAISQISGAAAHASVLGSRAGWKTFGQFVQNFDARKLAALEAEMAEHDAGVLMQLRGGDSDGLKSAYRRKYRQPGLPEALDWLSYMDKISVAAAWEGAKDYVEHHAAEFDGLEQTRNAADGTLARGESYWAAVDQKFREAVEETQPNSTLMQQALRQRTTDMAQQGRNMFKGQNFQNQGLLLDAVGDFKAQKARLRASDETARKAAQAEYERAKSKLVRVLGGQAASAAVFAFSRVLRDLILRRWDRWQDENGDVTAASFGKALGGYVAETASGLFLMGETVYAAVDNIRSGTSYALFEQAGDDSLNELTEQAFSLWALLNRDTDSMTEAERGEWLAKVEKLGKKFGVQALTAAGIPAQNVLNDVQALWGWGQDLVRFAQTGEGVSFDGLPESATGQYDRLYNAVQLEDTEQAAAALAKLELLGKADRAQSELKRRLKASDADVLAAAQAQNAGKDAEAYQHRQAVLEKVRRTLGSADAQMREKQVELVTGAVNEKANELLRGESESVYSALAEAVESGSKRDAQAELDRLLIAGKEKSAVKSQITRAAKPEWQAGTQADRNALEAMLCALEDAEGEKLYTGKEFRNWEKEDK